MNLSSLFGPQSAARFATALRVWIGTTVLAVSCHAADVTVSSEPVSAAAASTEAPLSQDEAIALALRNNQGIKVSLFSRAIGRANVLTAYGKFDPNLTYKQSHGENDLPISSNPLTTELIKSESYSASLDGIMPWGLTYSVGGSTQRQRGTFDSLSNNYVTFAGVNFTQPLLRGFGFGATLSDLRIAKANRAISDWQHRQTVIDIVTSVIFAYENLREARENLKIALGSRDLASQFASDNERRNKVGFMSDADVTEARARAASRDEQVLFARRTVHDLENQLRELMGDSHFIVDGPDFPMEPLTLAPELVTDGAADLRRALELRPDYQEARLTITKNRAANAFARSQLLPQVDLVGSYGYNGLDPNFGISRNEVRDRDHRAYSAGLVVSVPLTFAEGRGRARAAKLAMQQSQADLVRLEQDIAVSVSAAIGQLETTAQRVTATTRAYELAKQSLSAEEKKFKAGIGSTFIVLQYQEELAGAQSSQVHAIADQRRAIANYERVIGTTLVVHHINIE